MPSIWSWLSKKQNDNKRTKKTNQSHSNCGRQETDHLFRSTEVSIWGEPAWERMNGYSLAPDRRRNQRTSKTHQGFAAGLKRQIGSDARDTSQWSDARDTSQWSDARDTSQWSDARDTSQWSDARDTSQWSDARDTSQWSDARDTSQWSDARDTSQWSDARDTSQWSDARDTSQWSDARDTSQWSDARDQLTNSTVPDTNVLHLSERHPLNVETSSYPSEAVVFSDHPSSQNHIIPAMSVSETDRAQHIPAPQTENQLFLLQQAYIRDFSEPQRWSICQDYNPNVHQSHQLKYDIGGMYLPGQGRNKGAADRQMLEHFRLRQDTPKYDFPHLRYSSRGMQDKLAVVPTHERNRQLIPTHEKNRHLIPTHEINRQLIPTHERNRHVIPTHEINRHVIPTHEINRHLCQSQTTRNSAPFEDAKRHFPHRNSNNRNGFQEKMGRTFIAKESTHVLLTGRAQKIYPWRLMYEVSRPGARSGRIVQSYIPKALGQKDVSSLLCGGSIETYSSILPPIRATAFKENLVNGRPRNQQWMPDYSQGYPLQDICEPPQPGYSQGYPLQDICEPPQPDYSQGYPLQDICELSQPDYSQGYPLQVICEPPQPDYSSGSTPDDHIHRFPLGDIHERTKPAKPNGSTALGYMMDLSRGYANIPQPIDDCTRTSPSRSFTSSPRETVNTSRLLAQTANNSARVTAGRSATDFRTRDENSNSSTRGNDSLMPTRDAGLPTPGGRFVGFNEARLVDNNSHTFKDAGNIDGNVYITSNIQERFSPTRNTPNNRWETRVARPSSTEHAGLNDDEVNLALNQLDDATISEADRDVSRELEFIFQTEGEILY